MPVLTYSITVPAPIEKVHALLTDLSRVREVTEIGGVRGKPSAKMAAGVSWRNRGMTMAMPTLDINTVTEVTDARIALTTRSMVLGFIPSEIRWSYELEAADGGTRVTHNRERVNMVGVPFGGVVKLPFLPLLYMARGAMMGGMKKLAQTLGAR